MSLALHYKERRIVLEGDFVSVPNASSAPEFFIKNVSTDTRTIQPGALFFALRGENFDGHAYVITALEKGAALCVVAEDFDVDATLRNATSFSRTAHFLKVKDPLATLHELARAYRGQLDIPVIGVTGSNGKTTTKNLIAGVLSQKYKTSATIGNLNNHIGLPMSILNIEPDTEIAVFEAGINHKGEMKVLSGILKPTACVITNIGNAHIEFFGSREAIAEEKAMIASAAPADAPLFIPDDEDQIGLISNIVPNARVLKVDAGQGAVAPVIQKLNELNFKYINTPHVMTDVALAISVGLHYSVSPENIVTGILSAQLEPGRFDVREIGRGADSRLVIVDDTYNANPDSVCRSLSALRAMYPDFTLLLVLGQLKEQGDFLKEGYAKIYSTAKDLGAPELFLVEISANDFPTVPQDVSPRLHYFSSKQLCIDILTTYVEESLKNSNKKLAILVKGSRSSKMEDVVKGLVDDSGVQDAASR